MSSTIQLRFLGTGTSQGVPVIACPCSVCASKDSMDKRLRCSALITTSDIHLLIDAGPDFRQQMLEADIRYLDAIFLTHEHKDHTGGLDDVRALNYVHQAPVQIFAAPRVLASLKREYAYAFSDNPYPGVPEMDLKPITEEAEFFTLNHTSIQVIRAKHYKLPVLGLRVGPIAYLTDVNGIVDAEKSKLKGLDILVINALRKEKHLSHYCLEEALELIRELQPKEAYLTHISHQMGLHHQVQQELPEHVFLAYDGLCLQSNL